DADGCPEDDGQDPERFLQHLPDDGADGSAEDGENTGVLGGTLPDQPKAKSGEGTGRTEGKGEGVQGDDIDLEQGDEHAAQTDDHVKHPGEGDDFPVFNIRLEILLDNILHDDGGSAEHVRVSAVHGGGDNGRGY